MQNRILFIRLFFEWRKCIFIICKPKETDLRKPIGKSTERNIYCYLRLNSKIFIFDAIRERNSTKIYCRRNFELNWEFLENIELIEWDYLVISRRKFIEFWR